MTHFSAFTRISNFIQQHLISMKISTINWLDRISRDVIIIQTTVQCSDDIPEKYGHCELRQNKKYKHTQWNPRNTITKFKF